MKPEALSKRSTAKAYHREPSVWLQYKKHKYLLLMLAPGLIWYVIFYYGPLYGIQIAFKDYRIMAGIGGSEWVGLFHFKQMFIVSDFWLILRNTLLISFYHIVFGFPAPIVLALLFNELRLQLFKRIAQSISYLPHFFSWVILAGLLAIILSPTTGIVNQFIQWLGFEPIYFLGDKNYFRFTLVMSGIWKEIGWGTIIYLAALAGIDPHLYEAAVMDGASRFRQIIHITLPSIMPVIAILFILRIGHLMDAGFDQVLNLYNPAVYSVSDIIDTYVFRTGINRMQYSFTTAVGLFKNVVGFILVLLTNYIVKKSGQESLF
ncbi:ABC transporter permease [Paenibacillus allorhizosphaerae]|uniref:Multiple-sugar transport system permease YteP n=1 Tax=Paenibacillus allorhizosphaerae TaxID=2849866 RepID=A0ABM8VJF2_9BACL|nr:ABC transporter permease subunit [Paenibacillus allorhizosphaerae]CAG7645416.1 putative multiple-sugar transport system permease YteP [Paenibacillus allorhizosphaerae]